jgi:hypothetical protein
MEPGNGTLIKHCCVALLYTFIIVQQLTVIAYIGSNDQ